MAVTAADPLPAFAHFATTTPNISREVGATVVWLHGEQDGAAVPALLRAFAEAASGSLGDPDVVVDLRDVTFIDCSTVSALLRARSDLRVDGRPVTFRAPSRCVRRLFAVCGVDDVLGRMPSSSPAQGD